MNKKDLLKIDFYLKNLNRLYPPFVFVEARAHCTRSDLRYWLVLVIRTDFFLLALSLFPGTNPAQLHNSLSDSNCFIFTPISEIMSIADINWIPSNSVIWRKSSKYLEARLIISTYNALICASSSSRCNLISFILNFWSDSIWECLRDSMISSFFLHRP